uniref:Genome polyprotein n=1 Tax=Beihai picorna-like virus 37 TaxID=1922580 RepID=A0A1L3KHM9_9VIRU|nr:hypothetical protein 1 [Beihai picorna-like virus 37]
MAVSLRANRYAENGFGMFILEMRFHPEAFNQLGSAPMAKRRAFDKVSQLILENQAGLLDGIGEVHSKIVQTAQFVDRLHDMLERIKKSVCNGPNDDVVEAFIARLESLIILVVDCMRRESFGDMLLPMMQYIHTIAPTKSLAVKFVKLLTTILSEDSNGEAIDQSRWEPITLDQQSADLTDALKEDYGSKSGKFFSTHWDRLTEGHLGKRMAGAINLLILVGFLPQDCQNKVGSELYKVLHVQSMRKQHPSMFHHLFHTLDWVFDSVIPAIHTQDWSLLLFEEDYIEVDNMYRNSLDMVQLTITNQPEKLEEKYGIEDEAELIVYLLRTTAAHEVMRQKMKDDKAACKELNNRLIRLDKLAVDLQASWHDKGLRVQPYAVLLRGGSSVGKSVLANIACHVLSRANGFKEGHEYTVNINGSDKFQSNYSSKHVCVIFDDVGNTRPEKEESNPLFILIQFINNIHCAALSPEADKKGKTDIRSKIVIVTTNTSDLNSSFFSVNTASIMRRFQLVVDVKIKNGCANSSGGLHKRFIGTPYPDAWDLHLQEVVIRRSAQTDLRDFWGLRTIAHTDIVGYVDYLAESSPIYFEEQNKIVAAADSLHTAEHCPHHPMMVMPCPRCAQDPEFQPIEVESQQQAFIELEGQSGSLNGYDPKAQEEFLKNYWGTAVLENRNAENIPADVDETTLSPFERIKSIAQESVSSLVSFVQAAKEKLQDPMCQTALGIISIGLSVFSLYQIFRPKTLYPEGSIFSRIEAASRTPSNFVEKDNKYQRVYTNVTRYPDASVSSTLVQLENRIDTNLFTFQVFEHLPAQGVDIDEGKWGSCWPIENGFWLFPGHYFSKDDAMYRLVMKNHPGTGRKRVSALVTLQSRTMWRVQGADLVVCRLDRGGSTTSFSKYFLETEHDINFVKGMPLAIYTNHVSQSFGEPEKYVPPSSYKLTTKFNEINAIRTKLDTGTILDDMILYNCPTFKGMCGSMVVAMGNNPIIIGLHTAGDGDLGAATILTKAMFNFHEMVPKETIFIAEEKPLPSTVLDEDIKVSPTVHPFNPVHYQTEESNFDAIGQHDKPLSRFRSDIIESPLLPKLKEHGYEPTHAKPPKKAARPSRHRHMAQVTKELPPVNPLYLEAAVDDLKAKFSCFFRGRAQGRFADAVRLLSIKEAMSGVVGVKGFEPLNVKSAPGWPRVGPKWKFLKQSAIGEEVGVHTLKFVSKVVVDGKEYFEYTVEFDPDKLDAVRLVEDMFEGFYKGERVNVIFKCNLKDEPLSLKKIEDNKIRVFAGAPVDMVIATRMMTLSLINLMTYFPDIFEMAVGVDATGADWNELAKVLDRFDGECGDGDFKAFDTSLRPEFLLSAYEVLKMLLGASIDEDILKVFDGLATESSFPIYENDGFLYEANGSNPSGHGLTVIVNGLTNSLLMRYAYYAMHDCTKYGDIPAFHEVVALLTYGDDNIWTADATKTKFSMLTVAAELAKLGITYTAADKGEMTMAYKTRDEISFLKRSFHVHPVLGVLVGALEEASIFRSLALMRRPKADARETIAELCASNMNGALAELYYHSPDLYRKWLPIFMEMAAEVVDFAGNKVSDYFKPISEEEIIERFKATTCCYAEARREMFGEESQFPTLDYQSGELPEDLAHRLFLLDEPEDWSDIEDDDVFLADVQRNIVLIDDMSERERNRPPRIPRPSPSELQNAYIAIMYNTTNTWYPFDWLIERLEEQLLTFEEITSEGNIPRWFVEMTGLRRSRISQINIFHDDGVYFQYPLNFDEIQFRRFLFMAGEDWFLGGDYRFATTYMFTPGYAMVEEEGPGGTTFQTLLRHELNCRRVKSLTRAMMANEVKRVCSTCDGPHILYREQDSKAVRIYLAMKKRALLQSSLSDMLLPELCDHVSSFLYEPSYVVPTYLDPNLSEAGIRSLELLRVTHRDMLPNGHDIYNCNYLTLSHEATMTHMDIVSWSELTGRV